MMHLPATIDLTPRSSAVNNLSFLKWSCSDTHKCSVFFLPARPYGVGAGTVWLSGPNCTGSELHILRCQWSNSPCPLCPHRDDVAISCSRLMHIWSCSGTMVYVASVVSLVELYMCMHVYRHVIALMWDIVY